MQKPGLKYYKYKNWALLDESCMPCTKLGLLDNTWCVDESIAMSQKKKKEKNVSVINVTIHLIGGSEIYNILFTQVEKLVSDINSP